MTHTHSAYQAKRVAMQWLAVLLLALWSGMGLLRAQEIPQPMSPPRLVNDYAHLFSGAEWQTLEDSLVAFERATSTQIAVVTVSDLGGYAASEYATRLMEQWGVGSKEHDNGIVLLLKPRNQYGGGEVFIATGYGLEGALPDITVGHIIDNEMMPYLRVDNYYGATVAGTAAIRAAVRGEYTATPKREQADVMDWISGLFSVGVIIFMVIILNRSYKGGNDDDDDTNNPGGSGGRRYYRRGPMVFPPLFGGFGGFGGSSHGGGGFGGFGGFGGGSGGGGGAGRSF